MESDDLEGLEHILEKFTIKKSYFNIILATVDGLILQNLIGINDYPLEEISTLIARDKIPLVNLLVQYISEKIFKDGGLCKK
jgi:hypothetical protein